MKDPGEIRPPGRDSVLVVLRVEVSGDHISFALLDNPLLDRCHSSEIGPKPPYMSYSKCATVVQLTLLAG